MLRVGQKGQPADWRQDATGGPVPATCTTAQIRKAVGGEDCAGRRRSSGIDVSRERCLSDISADRVTPSEDVLPPSLEPLNTSHAEEN